MAGDPPKLAGGKLHGVKAHNPTNKIEQNRTQLQIKVKPHKYTVHVPALLRLHYTHHTQIKTMLQYSRRCIK